MAYTDTHETDILGVTSAYDDTAYCVDDAVFTLFNDDEQAFEAVDTGEDTSLIDKQGNRFNLIHEGTIQYIQFPSEWYPKGLVCRDCGAQIVPPQNDDFE